MSPIAHAIPNAIGNVIRNRQGQGQGEGKDKAKVLTPVPATDFDYAARVDRLAARLAANAVDQLDQLSLIGYAPLDPATREVYEATIRLVARTQLEQAIERKPGWPTVSR